jgi:hypothetical protein
MFANFSHNSPINQVDAVSILTQCAFGKRAWSRSIVGLIVWFAALQGLFQLMPFFDVSCQAGCHVGDANWYKDYHHGFQTNLDLRGGANGEEHSILVFENGELSSIPNPLPPACNSPGCRNQPSQDIGGVNVSIQVRLIQVGLCVGHPYVFAPLQSQSRLLSQYLPAIAAGFPSEIVEPPR